MRQSLLLLFALIGLLFLFSCQDDLQAEEPAYIHIPSVSFSSDYTSQGSASHKISDVWIYLNDNFIGAYRLPATFPVLKKDQGKLKVIPGVILNGISATRTAYPFYAGQDFTPKFEAGKVDTLKPSSTYRSGVSFLWKEDFESQGVTLRKANSSDTIFYRTSNDTNTVFEGTGSLAMYVDARAPIMRAETINEYPLPTRGGNAFLELNIKNTTPLYIGLLVKEAVSGLTVDVPYLGINPSNEWRKLYINLTPVVNAQPLNATYRVVLYGKYDTDKPIGSIFIDNLKLIY